MIDKPSYKPFDQELYNLCDIAKEKAVKAINSCNGYIAKVNPDPYGCDLIIYFNGRIVLYGEVAVIRRWDKEKFDDWVRLESRKFKYLTLDRTTLFIFFDNNQKNYCTIASTTFKKPYPEGSYLNTMATKYTDGEVFSQVLSSNPECIFNNMPKSLAEARK